MIDAPMTKNYQRYQMGSAGGGPMDVYEKTARRARQFGRSYPVGLADQLEWWGQQLGIERKHFLRLLGMSARQAEQAKTKDLKEIVADPQWEPNAVGLEGNLVRLHMLLGHDLSSLRDHLRQPAAPGEKEPLDQLVRRMHEGGTDWLPYLLASLAAARNGAGETGDL
jgi:hypothetical protein